MPVSYVVRSYSGYGKLERFEVKVHITKNGRAAVNYNPILYLGTITTPHMTPIINHGVPIKITTDRNGLGNAVLDLSSMNMDQYTHLNVFVDSKNHLIELPEFGIHDDKQQKRITTDKIIYVYTNPKIGSFITISVMDEKGKLGNEQIKIIANCPIVLKDEEGKVLMNKERIMEFEIDGTYTVQAIGIYHDTEIKLIHKKSGQTLLVKLLYE